MAERGCGLQMPRALLRGSRGRCALRHSCRAQDDRSWLRREHFVDHSRELFARRPTQTADERPPGLRTGLAALLDGGLKLLAIYDAVERLDELKRIARGVVLDLNDFLHDGTNNTPG